MEFEAIQAIQITWSRLRRDPSFQYGRPDLLVLFVETTGVYGTNSAISEFDFFYPSIARFMFTSCYQTLSPGMNQLLSYLSSEKLTGFRHSGSSDLLKHTDKKNPDHAALGKAVDSLKNVMT